MRISTQQLFQQGIATILQQQAQAAKTQGQLGSGLRVLTPADDPAASARIVTLNERITITDQHQENIQFARSRLELEDGVLDGVTANLQRVRDLAIQADSGVLVDADREAIAKEVRQRLSELVDLANTRDASGDYLFAGNKTRTKPYTRVSGSSPVTYSGDQGQRLVQIGADHQVAVGDSGHSVFLAIRNGNGTFKVSADPANTGTGVIDPGTVTDVSAWVPDTYTITFTTSTDYEVRDSSAALIASGSYTEGAAISFNGVQTSITGAPLAGDSFEVSTSTNQDLFTTLQNLVSTLERGIRDPVDQARFQNEINRFIVDVDQGLENILQVRTDVGARLNTVDAQGRVNDELKFQMQTTRSSLQDLDYVEATSRLNQQLLALQAAQQAFVRVQNLSLFNFLR